MAEKFTLDNAHRYGRHYDEQSFWRKLRRVAAKAGSALLYPALQLYYVLQSGDVPLKDKTVIIGALGYLILPADLVPDFLPLLGLTDDIAAISLALKAVQRNLTPAINEQARRQTERLMPADKPSDTNTEE
ncbi:MAG: DUF1232 domain-containing protein [Bacteroidales bacterium]|nr:DUF1232 domain-containing protein [Bacteroidales bacterium]